MIDLDFSQIRNHDGSQDNGFEELVCQLAHLSPPENSSYFVRKEGAGGDAGVECYWKLVDGSEHAWQAKYFLNTLESSQWSQISESVEAALKKHPNLTRYYICLPRDWTDSRKLSSKGKPVISAWDRWEEQVKKWKVLASNLGMTVEFEYWCKHDISLMLQRDSAEFSGRARYWFGKPILTNEHFSKLAEKSKKALGDRYTPECHLDLPISNILEAAGNTEHWWKELEDIADTWIESSSKAEDAISWTEEKSGRESIGDIRNQISCLNKNLRSGVNNRSLLNESSQIIRSLDELQPNIIAITNELLDVDSSKEHSSLDNIRRYFYTFEAETKSLKKYLKSDIFKAAEEKAVLLVGDAGIGKSHLLCDKALSRLDKGLPTVFLLGQHYSGGNPLSTLKDALDLQEIGNEEFLGALDAIGEANNTNTLIIIDAINEGSNREDWENHLVLLISDFSRYRHIGVVLSCRTTYVDWLVPEEIINNPLVKVTHYGFRGFEHRAAVRYLSQQGIVKPSAPVTSPEFTNPLFLKTCCKAMRDQGLTAFPKGMHGISSLLEFYIDGLESSVKKVKRYRSGENIVRKAVEGFALALYPENQFGVPINEAVELVNSFDTRKNTGESLFDVLLHEGVLAEDIEYNSSSKRRDIQVVRFTYERFSDHFIAMSLLENISDNEIEYSFSKSELFSPITKTDSYHNYVGVLGALGIIIAEKHGKEIIDLLPQELIKKDWLFEKIFIDTIQWRAASSFTDRSKELLNSIPQYGCFSKQLDILLTLSTEPNHPWNAEMIHQNLISISMPERDALWTTHIAVADSEEGDGEEESIIRAIIDWAHSGSLDGVESECVRLCTIVLIWMTSSTNRKVRDQATKSAVRLLTSRSDLLLPLLEKFVSVDDQYILERLYAIGYGVVTNVDDRDLLSNVSSWVWKTQFFDENPIPHLLLRDYARGIMEYSLYKGVLDKDITPEIFRPPYRNREPFIFPTKKELDELVRNSSATAIKSSIMGFPGDFGNYTMGCVHKWSPTPIGNPAPETAKEQQILFSDRLTGELKERFLDYLDKKECEDSKPFNFSAISGQAGIPKNNSFHRKKMDVEEPTEYELLVKEIEEDLSPEDSEYFRWVMGLGRSNSLASFSKKKAQRWVCKRAIEMGWKKDLFEVFEQTHLRYSGRSPSAIERIGKKYQWIAFYEFLALLSDNYCFKDPCYSDADNKQFYGPWQLNGRNIDPTIILRSTGDSGWDKWTKEFWWQPFTFPFTQFSMRELQEWVWDEDVVPSFENLLQVNSPDRKSWLVLKAFSSWTKDPKKEEEDNIPNQDAWYRINSCIIHKSDVNTLKKCIEGKNLCDPHILQNSSTGHQGYFNEYPWHTVYKDMLGWNQDFGFDIDCSVKNLVPVAEYEWESGSTDKSLDNSISIYLPAKELVSNLNLSSENEGNCRWLDDQKQTVFFDPSTEEKGPSAALCSTDKLYDWLEENEFQLVWLVGGEKQLFTHMASKFYGRLVFGGMYTLTKDGIEGELHFTREEPDDIDV